MIYKLDDKTTSSITAPEVLELMRWLMSRDRKYPEITVAEECYEMLSPGLQKHFKKKKHGEINDKTD